MKLVDLTRRMASLHRSAEKRRKATADEALQQWLLGYLQGLAEVSDIIKREQEIERTEQRLTKLKNDQIQEPEPDWSKAPAVTPNEVSAPANSNMDNTASPHVVSVKVAA